MQSIINDIVKERNRQDVLWGADRDLSHSRWLAILVEEVGEVAKAMQEGDWRDIRTELTQVAAVAVAWIENIDRNNEATK